MVKSAIKKITYAGLLKNYAQKGIKGRMYAPNLSIPKKLNILYPRFYLADVHLQMQIRFDTKPAGLSGRISTGIYQCQVHTTNGIS